MADSACHIGSVGIANLDEVDHRRDLGRWRMDEAARRVDETSRRVDETSRRMDETSRRMDGAQRRMDANIRRMDQESRRGAVALRNCDPIRAQISAFQVFTHTSLHCLGAPFRCVSQRIRRRRVATA